MQLNERAKIHAALGDADRLRIVDDLMKSDRTVNELADLVRMPGNLLSHHLKVLEQADLIKRRVSEGDRRRRYVSLLADRLGGLMLSDPRPAGHVLFVCTHNSARSQFAAALWRRRSGGNVHSAGSQPANRVHPLAVKVAAEFGIDLSRATPAGYDTITVKPDLVISVCDRAREAGVPPAVRQVHWSVPDPVPGASLSAFRAAFAQISERVALLSGATVAS